MFGCFVGRCEKGKLSWMLVNNCLKLANVRRPTYCGQHYPLAVGSELCENGEIELSTSKQEDTNALICLCSRLWMWWAICSSFLDFSALMDLNLELWVRTNLFSLKMLFVGVFHHNNTNKMRTHQLYNTMDVLGSIVHIVMFIFYFLTLVTRKWKISLSAGVLVCVMVTLAVLV